MLNTAEEIGLSPDIAFFRYEEEPWKAYDLQLKMVPYTTTSTFCDQMFLHFFGDDRIYSSSSSMSLSMFARMMRYEHTPMERLVNLIRSADRMTILPAQQISSSLVDSSRVVTFLVPLNSGAGSSKGVLLFLIKDSVYQSLFSGTIDGQVNTYIWQGDTLLSSAEELEVPADRVKPTAEAAPSDTFRWESRDWTRITYSSRNWGLVYTAVLRNADINSSIARKLVSNLAILPVFLVLCLIAALWMARRHAEPIRALTGLLSRPEEGASRDELQQISTGIRQLTTRNQELTTRLDRALPVQRHDFVFRFVKGRFASREEALAAGRAVGLEIGRAAYAVILCAGADGSDHPFDLGAPPFAGFAGCSGAGVELVALKANLYLVFADDPETLPALAEAIRGEGESAGGRCVTAVSLPHTDFAEAPAAYLEASAAYENRFVMGSRKVLRYSDISSNLPDILPQARKITTSISQALSLGSRELLETRINDLLHFLRNTDMSPFAFRMIYSDVINSLVHTHTDALADGASVQENYSIFTLTSCQSIDDLDELLRTLCDRLLSAGAAREDPAPEEDEITQVVRYMEEHFSDPEISMTALADSFELSTTRFSLSFKEKMGMSPLEYLTLLRVERAKELLSSTDLTIRDISALGCTKG